MVQHVDSGNVSEWPAAQDTSLCRVAFGGGAAGFGWDRGGHRGVHARRLSGATRRMKLRIASKAKAQFDGRYYAVIQEKTYWFQAR